MMLTLEKIREVIDSVIDSDKLLYDLHVTTPPDYLIRQRHQDTLRPEVPDEYRKTYHVSDQTKSIIVWSIFTKVAGDYFFQSGYLYPILDKLNDKFNKDNIFFDWDDYNLNRKQFAVRSGAGKISKPSLVFSNKFGLNAKFELLFTTGVFDQYTINSDVLKYENCIDCDAPCQTNCPEKCRMDYELIDWEKCSNFVNQKHLFENPNLMCRTCIESCPYSNDILTEIDSKYGKYIHPNLEHLNHG